MAIGVLQTGRPPSRLAPEFGSYSAMVEDLIGPGFDYQVFDVEAGELPDPAAPYQGLVITGSSAGVYDPLPWIGPLEAFLRTVKGRTPLVGICFGHQIMAQAFGGRAERSANGRANGLHRYDIVQQAAWMDGPEPISVAVAHQDQVTRPPPGAVVLAGSDFTPFGILAYPGQAAISMQCHPEFSPAFAKALYGTPGSRRELGEQADAAIASMDAPNDRERVGGWIRRFLANPL